MLCFRTGQSRVAKPYWDKFENGYLNTDKYQRGKKGDEFGHVYKNILAGESGGAYKFSIPKEGDELVDGLDWSAWLLFHLVDIDTKLREGCFYNTHLTKIECYRVAWNLVKNELRNRNRASNRASQHKSPRTLVSTAPQRRRSTSNSSSSSENEGQLDPNAGIARVSCDVPDELADTECSAAIRVLKFCVYTEAQFCEHLVQEFNLKQHNLVISKLYPRNYFSFRETQQDAAQSKTVYFNLETHNAVIEEEIQTAPPGVVPDLAQFQGEHDAANRSLAWAEMVNEAKSNDANRRTKCYVSQWSALGFIQG